MTGTRGRACTGKKSHTSRQHAAEHRDQLIARGAAAEGLRAYRCRHCGSWHVGHTGPPGQRTRR